MSESAGFAQYPSLRDRVVVITGGGSGIGASMVEHFCMQGARVALLDILVKESQDLVRSLEKRCGTAPLFMECDLKNIAALREAFAKVAQTLGPVRVLVNNAANDDRHKFSDVTPEYWEAAMAVNLRHQFFAMQAVIEGRSVIMVFLDSKGKQSRTADAGRMRKWLEALRPASLGGSTSPTYSAGM